MKFVAAIVIPFVALAGFAFVGQGIADTSTDTARRCVGVIFGSAFVVAAWLIGELIGWW